MGALLPILLAVVGTGAGVALGIMMMPAPPEEEAPAEGEGSATAESEEHSEVEAEEDAAEDLETPFEYARLNNQFVIPVVRGDRVAALVVMSISLEMEPGTSGDVFSKEPKVRDSLLQVLFDHANVGGFDGPFTASGKMSSLRHALREAARKALGPDVHDILVLDIVRQEFD